MDTNETISARRSAREYTAQAIDAEVIRRLVDIAEHEPNGVNHPPRTFTVVSDQGLLNRIWRDESAHMLATIPACPSPSASGRCSMMRR
jgi:nitroreductase